jgi:hypothetical protein
MKKQVALIALVLAISVALRAMRIRLAGTGSPILMAWPSQVIFGFYFAIFTLAIQALQRLHDAAGRDFRRQALLLLMLIGVCLDLILVNVQEITGHVDASYGPVFIWAPFYPSLYRVLQHIGVPTLILNCLQFLAAAGITLILWHRDVFGIGTRFGITRTKSDPPLPLT